MTNRLGFEGKQTRISPHTMDPQMPEREMGVTWIGASHTRVLGRKGGFQPVI